MDGIWLGDIDLSAGALYHGDGRQMLRALAARNGLETAAMAITSPPYHVQKAYEAGLKIDDWLPLQREVIKLSMDLLLPTGSLCWQVGTYVDRRTGGIIPLDTLLIPLMLELGLTIRGRIIWYRRHGLHARYRMSGRHETIVWATKSDDRRGYRFTLDRSLRVTQRNLDKRFSRGHPRAGERSCDPRGANSGDVWAVPPIRAGHPERTGVHPCQMPLEVAERLILAMSEPGDLIVDPFAGVGTTMAAALLHGRRAVGADLHRPYLDVAARRVHEAREGTLPRRPWCAALAP